MSLLPGLTQSAPGVPIFAPASGGGGGGGGPNIAVSTITFNNGAGLIDADYECNDTSTPEGISVQLGNNSATLFAGQIALQGLTNAVAGVYATLRGGVQGDPYGQTTIVADCRNFFIEDAGKPTNLYVSSILCSTINGAAPGGGGSYPPNPAFSSISFGDGNTNFNFQGAPPSGTSIVFTNGGMSAPAPIAFNMGCNISSIVPSWPLSNSYPGDFIITQDTANLAGNLVMGSIAAVGNVIASISPTGVPIDLPIVANNVNMSSLVVSSINGVVPGGGSVPADLAVSSLTVSKQPTALSSIFQIQAADPNLYTLQVADSNSALVAGMSVGLVGGRNQVYINSNAQIQNQLWVSSIQRCSEAFVSSFNVSSINGAVYPPATSAPAQKLTWLNSGSNTLPSGGIPGSPVTLTSASASLTNGHTYRVTASVGLSNADSTGISYLTVEGAWGGLAATIWEAPNSAISSSTGAFFGGYSGYFTTAGGSGGVTIGGVNTGNSNTTVVGDNSFVILEDLGAI